MENVSGPPRCEHGNLIGMSCSVCQSLAEFKGKITVNYSAATIRAISVNQDALDRSKLRNRQRDLDVQSGIEAPIRALSEETEVEDEELPELTGERDFISDEEGSAEESSEAISLEDEPTDEIETDVHGD